VAHGIRITPGLLTRIDRAEQAVRALGFDQVRVRHLGDTASIEVRPEEVHRLVSHPEISPLLARLRALGWVHLRIDLQGYRQGTLNPAASV
jgi:uncharacterized protein